MPKGVYERNPVSEKTRKLIAKSLMGKKSHLYKHGVRYHPLYSRWINMKTRCYNENRKEYKNYGGRGIIVCDEWLNDPVAFVEWGINNGYKKELEIDRIDNDGNYEPGNCRFVIKSVNQLNKVRRTK